MRRREEKRFIFTFLAPPLALYLIFVIVPALNAVRYSLMRWDGLGAQKWVGLKNFATILRGGSDFATAIGHNVFLTVVPGVIILTMALWFAYSIHQRIRGARLFRIAFFFPNIISSVAIALLWVLIYSTSDFGLVNHALREWHIRSHAHGAFQPVPFTQSANLLPSLVPMIVWSATGFYMVLFLAGMESIPESYYEAARLDGATSARLFFSVTLPLMWDVLTTGIVFLVVGGMKFFDAVWIMENGRPSPLTHTMSTLMYSRVFEEYDIGYGTAVAVMMFVLVLIVTLISIRFMKRERLEY
jgi:ABC-type sugar transport system permease subunit